MPSSNVLRGSISFVLSCFATAAAFGQETKYFHDSPGGARCVLVNGVSLAHTAQVLGATPKQTEAPLTQQVEAALTRVDRALRDGGSGLDHAVKLNVYLAKEGDAEAVRSALKDRFEATRHPAICLVTTKLPGPSTVAVDAVGVVTGKPRTPRPARDLGGRVGASCATLPPGTRVYISGQAQKGDGSLRDATRQTLASLGKTLDFLGLAKRDVVHVKSFLGPMRECGEAEKSIQAFFDGKAPPCAFVEWSSSLPIEIEMVVRAAGNAELSKGPMVEVRTPPGMSTPAVYSRLTIARHPQTVFIGGLYPEDPTATPEAQLRSLFTNLKRNLDATGSDWMHLVKATYYVSDDELNKWHNRVRPDYFSPRRPPAASKAKVGGVAKQGHGITMDFIVTPGEP